jgi:GNAT superfamily N-acetyltransferase
MLDNLSVMVGLMSLKASLVHDSRIGVQIRESHIGAATLFTCEQWPRDIGFNRAYGVDAQEVGHLAAIAGNFTERGLRPLLELEPERIHAAARAELARLGLVPVWEVMELRGAATVGVEQQLQDITVHESDPAQSERFAALAVDAYEFSPQVRAEQLVLWAHHARDPSSWCLIASVAGTPCAVGILSVIEGVAVFNGAATLPAFRKRGCQAALLRRRIELANERGLRDFFVRTVAGSDSQRNLERFGLCPTQLRQVWGVPLRPA